MVKRWLILTAGLGNPEIVAAAIRIKHSVSNKNELFECFVVKNEDLMALAPFSASNFSHVLSEHVKGFGFYCWKSELVHAALSGKLGEYTGVIWVDAGCEITLNVFSLNRLKKFMKIAEKEGVFSYTLNYPESAYTKKELMLQFPSVGESDPQFQATWFLLSGQRGLDLAREWQQVVSKGLNQVDLTLTLPQDPIFIEHRFDQSVLSVVFKSNGVKTTNYQPPSGRGFLSRSGLRGISHPIWSSRNRSGKSIKNRAIFTIEKISSDYVRNFKID